MQWSRTSYHYDVCQPGRVSSDEDSIVEERKPNLPVVDPSPNLWSEVTKFVPVKLLWYPLHAIYSPINWTSYLVLKWRPAAVVWDGCCSL